MELVVGALASAPASSTTRARLDVMSHTLTVEDEQGVRSFKIRDNAMTAEINSGYTTATP
jgi:hypothetical protein